MIDFEKIKTIYNFSSNLTFEDIQALMSVSKKKIFQANEYLISEGSTKKEIFFILNGLVRSFKLNPNGEETTISLCWENQVLASYDIILFDSPSQYYFEAIEPTNVFIIDYDILQIAIAQNSALETNRKYVLHDILRQYVKRVDSFVLLSPEERYIDFMESNPHIAHRVPDKYIANILGITPVSLSRIRKRIAQKKK